MLGRLTSRQRAALDREAQVHAFHLSLPYLP